jgi:hypothetical protein
MERKRVLICEIAVVVLIVPTAYAATRDSVNAMPMTAITSAAAKGRASTPTKLLIAIQATIFVVLSWKMGVCVMVMMRNVVVISCVVYGTW